jgi:hypothetical protein
MNSLPRARIWISVGRRTIWTNTIETAYDCQGENDVHDNEIDI